jgi:hypothetical protein
VWLSPCAAGRCCQHPGSAGTVELGQWRKCEGKWDVVLSTRIAYLRGPASMICYYRVNRNILGEKTTQSSNAGPTTRSGGGGGFGRWVWDLSPKHQTRLTFGRSQTHLPNSDTNRIEKKNPLFKNLVQNLHTAKMKNKRNLCLVDCKDRLNDWNFLSAFILTDQFLVYRGSLLKQISDGNNFKQTILNIIKNSKDLAITLQHLS